MALISPGVQVTVSDESQYQPTAQGTVAYVLLATEQDKLNPSGTVAIATTAANANKLVTVTSQRELTNLFGAPKFQVDASGNPLHADERNEYGLLAAYSALGVSNRLYIQRANVDLAQLTGTSIRPTGASPDGVYWLDYENSNFGIYEWEAEAINQFSVQTPIFVTDRNDLMSGNTTPNPAIGKIGDYAVVTATTSNPVYHKRYDNTWQLVGSKGWQLSTPAIIGGVSNPVLPANAKVVINNVAITTGTTLSSAVSAINSALGELSGVIATVNAANQIELRVNADASYTGDANVKTGNLQIALGTTVGYTDAAEALGLFSNAEAQTTTVKSVNAPTVQFSSYRDVPAWRSTDLNNARPSGSVWLKTSATGSGANWAIKQYDAVLDTWTLQSAPLYASDNAAIAALDPTGGGAGISTGAVYIRYDIQDDNTTTFKPYYKATAGVVKITGTTPTAPLVLVAGDSFIMRVSVPNSSATVDATITLSGTTITSFVADILAANLPNITAIVESSGAVSISHLAGGTIEFTYITGSPLTTLGLISDSKVQTIVENVSYLVSPFREMVYVASDAAPYSNPVDGTLWYYNNPLEVDIMINDGTKWRGYRNVGNDARGYDLSLTDPMGVILSTTEPTTQSDGSTALAAGDLWLDTGDLENYPTIRRYDPATGWQLIDNTDQVTVDGIVFADARWNFNGSTDPVSDAIPEITPLLTSDYLDPDAPDYRLYARGTLLFNTRRSGYNVKRFESAWFANEPNPPAEVGAWVSTSGVDERAVPYFGHKAQRNVVVEALKSGIASSVESREEQVEYNLIVCPGYPELISDMVTLNNDRKNTAFIIGDAPLTLTSGSTEVEAWAKNTALAADNNVTSLVTYDPYLAVYYPAGRTTDLSGESVVVPASHIMLRTMIRSDNQSYVWFAPAGVRRGIIDNATSIGYVDISDNNNYRSIGVAAGLRDVLYANGVNPLTVLPGVGLVAYGQKTRSPMTSAMDRVNVARLVVYLRKVLDQIARPFIFEPNDTITRNQVKQAFEAVLNDIVAKRGITDYLVVCDTSNNTPDRIDRNELYIDIAIEPMKAVEFIYIPVRLKNTGDIAAGL